MTWSALCSSVCGIVSPSTFAVEVDDQLEGRGLLHGEVSWLGALEDLVHEDGGAPEEIREVRTVTDESANLGILLRSAGTGQAVCEGEIGDPLVARKNAALCTTMTAPAPARFMATNAAS